MPSLQRVDAPLCTASPAETACRHWLISALFVTVAVVPGCGSDGVDLTEVRGVWDFYSSLSGSADRCRWPRVEIDSQSIKFVIAKDLTQACYHIQSVQHDRSRYTFALQELSASGPADSLAELDRLGIEATTECAEGLASGRQGGPTREMILEVAGGMLRIQTSPHPMEGWEELELSYAPAQCQTQ